jgi:hypothetical protein
VGDKIIHFLKVVVPGLLLITALSSVLVLVPSHSERNNDASPAAAAAGTRSSLRANPAHATNGKRHALPALSFPAPRTTKHTRAFPIPTLGSRGLATRTKRGDRQKAASPNAASHTASHTASQPKRGQQSGSQTQSGTQPGKTDRKTPASVKGAAVEPGGADPSTPTVYSGGAAQCNQDDLQQRGAAELQKKLGPPLRPLPARTKEEKVDWQGVGLYLKALLRPVPKRPGWARSLRAYRNARIHYKPDLSSDEVGLLAINSRIMPYGYTRGRGCRGRWVAVGPRAYICRRNFVWDKRKPLLVDQPPMEKDDITPGRYAYVRKGGAAVYSSRKAALEKDMARKLPTGFFVRFKRFVRIGEKNYWKTTKNWYIPVSRLARHVPSEFSGIHLEKQNLALPLAFLWRDARLYDKPGGTTVDKLSKHSAVRILGYVRWGRRRFGYFRVGPCRWIRASATRPVWPTRPPPGVHRGDQWIDIRLDNQTLTAYVGAKPVFATIISSGDEEHPTQHGIFRVYWKVTETDMTSDMGAEEQYMAESVPWSLFFWKGQAIHGAYWHNSFGVSRSHGCVNLAPRDAHFLHDWARPELPDGWIYRWFGERFPGILIRVRRTAKDHVRYLGFARQFAPEKEVQARDAHYRHRIRQETIELLKKSRQKNKTEKAENP